MNEEPTPTPAKKEKPYPHCPHCGRMINPGTLLGIMNRGVPKNFTRKSRKKFREQLAEARKKRWPQKAKEANKA